MDQNVNQELREGQIVRVFQKFTEGKRERNVPFMGRLLKVRGIGVNKTITVKQNLEGVDVEKIFPLALPTITKIEILEEKKVKKGKSGGSKKAKKARATASALKAKTAKAAKASKSKSKIR